MASKYEISTVFKMIDNFSGPIKKMAGSSSMLAKGISADMAKTRMQIQSAGKAIKATAGIAAAASVALAGKTVVDSIKTYVEFEDAVTKAGTKFKDLDVTSETYADTLEQLQGKAREVGAVTKFSATDAAGALDKMAMAGMTSNQAMGMLMGTSNLAAAVGLDLTSAVDMATDAMGAFGLTVDEEALGPEKAAQQISTNMNRIADVVARTTNMANTDMSMWFEAVKSGAPQFTALGGDIETFSAAVGILANSGIKGGEAGTALRNVMLRLSAPAKAGADALNQLGINVFDSEGKMLPFIDIMQQFEKSLDGVADEQKAKLLSDIFGSRAIGSFQVLMQAGTAELTKFTNELYNSAGAAETMASAQMQSFQGLIEQLKSAYQDKQLSLGKAFEVGGAKEALQNLIAYVQNFDVTPIANALTQIMGAIPSIVSGFVNFISILWDLKEVIGTVAVAWGVYKAVLIAVNIVTMANPVGLIVAAFVALIAIIIESCKHWESWGAMVVAVFALISPPIAAFIALIMEFKNNIENIKSAFTDGGFVAGIKTIGGTIVSAILHPIEQVLMLISKIPGIGKIAGVGANAIAGFREEALTGWGAVNNQPAVAPVTQGERTAYSMNETITEDHVKVDIGLEKGLKGSVSGTAPNISISSLKSGAW